MATSLIEDTLERTDKVYNHGALRWIKRHRPGEWAKMLTLEGEINKMALERNKEGLRKALNAYRGLILAMVREYKAIGEEKGQNSK